MGLKPLCLRTVASGVGSGESVDVLKWGNGLLYPKYRLSLTEGPLFMGVGVVEDILFCSSCR